MVAADHKHCPTPVKRLVWGKVLKKYGAWLWCSSCAPNVGWAKHGVGIDGACLAQTQPENQVVDMAASTQTVGRVARACRGRNVCKSLCYTGLSSGAIATSVLSWGIQRLYDYHLRFGLDRVQDLCGASVKFLQADTIGFRE